MSDPSNPYGLGGETPTAASQRMRLRPSHSPACLRAALQQPAYGTSPHTAPRPSYGAGVFTGKPMYGQVVYALNPATSACVPKRVHGAHHVFR